MNVLAATRRTQGDRAGDLCWTIDGELVYLGMVCDRDLVDPDRGCGCGRVFTGLDSHHATTTAEVSEMDITPDDFMLAVLSGMRAAGWVEDPPRMEDVEWVERMVKTLLADAASYPAGTVLGRRLDELTPRT